MVLTLKKIKTLLILCVLLMIGKYSYSQSCKSCIIEDTIQGIWEPLRGSLEFELKNKDINQKIVSLVFEMQFDDSIMIEVNNKLYLSKSIKTKPLLSMIGEAFEINYSEYDTIPNIKVTLLDKKRCIAFKPMIDYGIVYINRLSNSYWTLEFSNFGKRYY